MNSSKTTPIPNSYIDIFMPFLTDPEWKVLCYIIRLTQNNLNAARQIKLSEFSNGRVTKDGERLDYGTGLAQNTCRKALKSLKKLGLIIECTNRDNCAKSYAPQLDPDKVKITILQERLGEKMRRNQKRTKVARIIRQKKLTLERLETDTSFSDSPPMSDSPLMSDSTPIRSNNQISKSRLARCIKESRENWRETALRRQQKIRKLEFKIRNLKSALNKWKNRAKEAERKLRENQAVCAQNNVPNEIVMRERMKREIDECALSAPSGHMYPVFIIQLAIQQIIYGLNSLRGCQKNFEIFSQFFPVPTPNFNTIRNWLFRLGLYELQKKHPRRSDWIVILDLTVELGNRKALVILGIPAANLPKTGFALQHQDVVVLDIAVLSSSTGELVQKKLDSLSKQIGTPLQIVADHGSDLKKGIELYKKLNPTVIYTYDVTHQMGLLLKKELKDDQNFQSFLQQCTQTRHKIQQTKLYFLIPPKQRLKSRYLNIDTHLRWAEQVLEYFKKGDFSYISTEFIWDKKSLSLLQESLSPSTLTALSTLEQRIYPDLTTFSQKVSQHIGATLFAPAYDLICQAASVGRRKFVDKLGWLMDYESDMTEYSQMINLVHTIQKQVKKKGLNQNSKNDFVKNTSHLILTARGQRFKEQIEVYLSKEGQQIPDKQSLLATSDLIESILGKYKFFSNERSLKEMGQILLTIPLFTTEVSSDLVKEAMESIRTKDLEKWSQKVFGQSMLSKRRAILTQNNITPKLNENN